MGGLVEVAMVVDCTGYQQTGDLMEVVAACTWHVLP